MKISIIIPVYNEAKTLIKVVEKVLSANVMEGIEKEIIVVDDGSTDGSTSIVRSLSDSRIKKILLSKNCGKGAAIKQALHLVSGDYILIQDADLEYDPKNYNVLLIPIIKAKAMVVFGSRFLKQNPRRIFYTAGNKLATHIFNFIFGTYLTDIATCYKIFPRELIPQLISVKNNDFIFDVVRVPLAIVKAGYLIHEVPIDYSPRFYKEGKKLLPEHGFSIIFYLFKLLASQYFIGPTRGFGLLEGFLSRKRACRANDLIEKVDRGGTILDIGCGRYPQFLMNTRFAHKYGLDRINDSSTRALFTSLNINFVDADIHNLQALPFSDNYFSVVTMLAVLEHINPKIVPYILVEINRVLKPDGIYVFTTPTPVGDVTLKLLSKLGIVSSIEIAEHKKSYTRIELCTLLNEAGFTKIKFGHFEFFMNRWAIAQK